MLSISCFVFLVKVLLNKDSYRKSSPYLQQSPDLLQYNHNRKNSDFIKQRACLEIHRIYSNRMFDEISDSFEAEEHERIKKEIEIFFYFLLDFVLLTNEVGDEFREKQMKSFCLLKIDNENDADEFDKRLALYSGATTRSFDLRAEWNFGDTLGMDENSVTRSFVVLGDLLANPSIQSVEDYRENPIMLHGFHKVVDFSLDFIDTCSLLPEFIKDVNNILL